MDYPPKMCQFKVVSPMTCVNYSISDTLWWALNREKKGKDELNEKQMETLKQILQELEGIEVKQLLYRKEDE